MRVLVTFLQSVLVAGCLNLWVSIAAGSEQTIDVEEELSPFAKIRASLADAICENDEKKYSDFYQGVRNSIQSEGKFENYYPNNVYCFINCEPYQPYQGSFGSFTFEECCNNSQNLYIPLPISTSYKCNPCDAGYPEFKPHRDLINVAEPTVTCHGNIDYPGLQQEDFTWCIYQMSNDDYDIHGCLNASGIIDISNDAATIKLLHHVWIDTETKFDSNQGVLSISNSVSLFERALFTCSVNNKNMSAIQFLEIDTYVSHEVTFDHFGPPLPQVVRVGDALDGVYCDFITKRTVGVKFSWVHAESPDIPECTENCSNPVNTRNSSRVEYYTETLYDLENENDFRSCALKLSDEFLIKRVLLSIHNVTINDTGEYYCEVSHFGLLENNIIFTSPVEQITIVLFEFPKEEREAILGMNDSVACGVKTFMSANVSWWFEMQELVPTVEEDENTVGGFRVPQCGEETDVFATRSVTQQENGFALFLITLHFCNLSSVHLGRYSCVVSDEAFDDEIDNTTFTFTLTGTFGGTTSVDEQVSSVIIIIIVPVCVGVLLILLVIVTVTVLVMVKRVSDKQAYYRKCSLNSTSTIDSAQSKLFFMFKQIGNDSWEFPYSKLDYVKELGVGRFGRVYKAYAEDVTPTCPNKSMVAVKTTKELAVNVTHAAELWDELQLMKGIEPHPHICNMLAYCISPGGMPSIIVEYAVHGNLKDILVQCRLALLKAEKAVKLLSNEESPSLYRKGVVSCDTEKEDCDQAALLFPPNKVSADTVPLRNYALIPQAISESDVYKMASQILAGLMHLEHQKIVHRDISARNILVAKGFTIKISDFGFARDISQTEYYRKMTNGLIPIKWVAPEGLERQIYTCKSDVWSCGVLLWEIASYGEVPYHNINISDDWDYFLKLLGNGHRLPQPAGCSNQLYNIMNRCWEEEPARRPSFSDLACLFQNLLEQSKPPTKIPCQETVV